MNRFNFNGTWCRDFGIYVSGSGTFNAPELDTVSYEVPGRNGDIIVSNERYKNIVVPYPAFIRKNFKLNAERARQWLLSPQGYKVLFDDYNPHTFRMARFIGPLDFETRFLNQSGECTLSFDCKPQRYLWSGQDAISIGKGKTLINPTAFVAKPLIIVYGNGNGTLTVNDTVVTLTGIQEMIYLDSETQNAERVSHNENEKMQGEFPTLKSGENVISTTGGITGVVIHPRWWIL